MRKPADFEFHPASFAYARQIGCNRAFCHYVADGDTFDVFVDLGFNQYGYLTIRLHDFDTAEIFHPSSKAELAHGMAAKARVTELLLEKPCLIRSYKDAETFGRYVADVYYFPEPDLEKSLALTLDQEGFRKRVSYA